MFSSSETAFYRIPKVRLKLDAMENDSAAKRILWFVNNPAQFVSTILVGNNVANYMVSTAAVFFIGAVCTAPSEGVTVEIISTLILTPFLFVYGEMFPKYISLNIPNRILRLVSRPITFFSYLFYPVTALLCLLNRIISRLLGQTHQGLQLTLGRQDLAHVFSEGQETGILVDVQRQLANGVFSISNRNVSDYILPKENFPLITTDMSPEKVLEIAREFHLAELPVYETETIELPEFNGKPKDMPIKAVAEIPAGIVRVIDLEASLHNGIDRQSKQLLQLMRTQLPLRSTVEISGKHSLLTAMILMQTLHCSFGCVINQQRQCTGFVQSAQLRRILFGKPMPQN
jgi:CBS domain containing-hemolysin-like protein